MVVIFSSIVSLCVFSPCHFNGCESQNRRTARFLHTVLHTLEPQFSSFHDENLFSFALICSLHFIQYVENTTETTENLPLLPLARSTLNDAIVVLWLQNGSFLIKGWIEIWPLRSLSKLSIKGQLISKRLLGVLN